VRFIAVGDVMVAVVADRLSVSGERAHGSVRLRDGGSGGKRRVRRAEL
jgi:hypothetical protein